MRKVRIIGAVAIAVPVIVEVALLGYIGAEGSRTVAYGDGVPHPCTTPPWPYEAINYDVARDAQRMSCEERRRLVGDEVVASDGVRVAGWYIPAGNGAPPSAPTVVIVHGWNNNKTDTIRYAATIHDEYNVVLVDTRAQDMTIGANEALDLQAMLDWLVRTKRPDQIAFLGDSGGAAASGKLARTDERIDALIFDSPHARARFPFEVRIGAEAAKQIGPLAPPASWSAWVVLLGVYLRTGAWPSDADPLDTVAALAARATPIPLAILYGTADDVDLPDRNAKLLYEAARQRGLDVELHACPDAAHGQVVTKCPEEYRAWLRGFLRRAFAPAAHRARTPAESSAPAPATAP